MVDVFDRATRSRLMSRIRSKDTVPELVVRSYLHRRGLRFRLHVAKLPGKPDLVFPRHRAAIFIHGCFWHRHDGCPLAANPSSNEAFWNNKFEANRARDRRQVAALISLGWRVAVFWECGARKGVANIKALRSLERWIKRGRPYCEFPT